MKLIEYEGKWVRILSAGGNTYEGRVGDHCYPEDDENNLEMIVVDFEMKNGKVVDQPVGLYEKDIESIEVIEQVAQTENFEIVEE